VSFELLSNRFTSDRAVFIERSLGAGHELAVSEVWSRSECAQKGS